MHSMLEKITNRLACSRFNLRSKLFGYSPYYKNSKDINFFFHFSNFYNFSFLIWKSKLRYQNMRKFSWKYVPLNIINSCPPSSQSQITLSSLRWNTLYNKVNIRVIYFWNWSTNNLAYNNQRVVQRKMHCGWSAIWV